MRGIYKITNLKTNEFYIGCSIDIKKRFMTYRTPARIKNPRLLINKKIKEYGLQTFKFEVFRELPNNMNLSEIKRIESETISSLRPHYNLKNNGYVHSKETKEKIKKTLQCNWENKPENEKQKIIKNQLTGKGKNWFITDIGRKRISEAHKGKKLSKEHRKKISESLKGKPRKNKHIMKKVVQIDKETDDIINVFDMVKDAANHVGVTAERISNCLTGKRKSCHGFKWQYYKGENNGK